MAPRPPLQSWSSPSPNSPKLGCHPPPQPKHTTMAPCNGTTPTPPKLAVTPPTIAPCNATTSTPPKLVVTLPPNHRTLQWHPAIAPSNGTTSTQPRLVVTFPPTIAHYNGTLRRHPAMAPRPLHPAMSPCNGTTSTQPQHTTMAPCNGTQQWHHVHSTIAHYNGTQQWHHVHSTIAHYNGTLQWHPAMAPCNGTTSTAPCNGILVPRPMRKSGSSPSPPIGSKNPYSYRYMGNNSFHSILGRSKSTTLLEDRPCLTSICQAHLSKIHAVYSDKIGSFPLPPNMGNTNQETLKTHENNTLMPISVQNGPNRWKQRYLVKWCVEVCWTVRCASWGPVCPVPRDGFFAKALVGNISWSSSPFRCRQTCGERGNGPPWSIRWMPSNQKPGDFMRVARRYCAKCNIYLVGGWANPCEKYAQVKLDHLSRKGWKFQKYLKPPPSY